MLCMEFEFDPAKSAANKRKHGIDFEETRQLWNDDNGFEFAGSFESETRSLIVGKIGVVYWTAIVTYRTNRVRIISVRRARDLEIACYEG